ncbi:MAG: glycerol-3-phosphate acyltransferase [Firmicutes bacterium]|nr:glycerol-3-phosphate acyltransferase [Bacillota bacterium]
MIQKSDIRKFGSGNPGTTNMFRVYGLRMGFLTFACDCGKGVICCVVSRAIFNRFGADVGLQAAYFSGLFAVVGHVFPVLYRFRGGKGVATGMGVMFALQPVLMLCCLIPIATVILLTDRMSVMSLLFSVFVIVWSWVMLLDDIGLFCCAAITLTFAIVIFAHRRNIVRLFTGKENRIGMRKALLGRSEHRLRELKEREERRSAADNGSNADDKKEE